MNCKLLSVLFFLTLIPSYHSYNPQFVAPEPPSEWDTFIEAVIWKESKNDTLAIGDNGKAVGCLQMWSIMVKEANRVGHTNYTDDDRYSKEKSIAMFKSIQDYHNPKHDFDKALRIWNPKHPQSYRDDIMDKYNELRRTI